MDSGKICSKCKTWKPLGEFVAARRYKSGYAAKCKTCHNIQNRTYHVLFSVCAKCKERKPRTDFASKRICNDCKEHKTCKICGNRLSLESFDGYHGLICRSCEKRRNADRYVANRESFRERNKEWYKKNAQPDSPYRQRQKNLQKERRRIIRHQAIEHYGGHCACCGETENSFLTIDHIYGNGGEHRRQIKRFDVAYWLYLHNYPEGYQILCFNCNVGRYHNGGICPHKAQA